MNRRQTVTIQPFAGEGFDGQTWGDPVEGIAAQLVREVVQTTTVSGQDVTATATAEMAPRDVPVGSLLTCGTDRYTVLSTSVSPLAQSSMILTLGPA